MQLKMIKNVKRIAAAALSAVMVLSSYTIPVMADTQEIPSSRIQGQTRYDTSLAISTSLVETTAANGGLSGIVVASGDTYPDALAGDYLASVYDAPMVLTNASNYWNTLQYANQNLVEQGNVFLLGGVNSLSKDFEDTLVKAGFNVERLGGQDRYDTNLKILKRVYQEGNELFVCTGKNFADSLSVSSLEKPILLVDNDGGLTEDQKNFLEGACAGQIYIIGGTGAVSEAIEAEIKELGYEADGRVCRLYGSTRYETAKVVNDYFFGDTFSTAYLVSGNNFPDGLSVGPLAAAEQAPIFLVNDDEARNIRQYMLDAGVSQVNFIGGTGAISTKAENIITGAFNLDSVLAKADDITNSNISPNHPYYNYVLQCNRECATAQFNNPNIGQDLANWARQWAGVTPYVSGGSSLTGGADCLGFVRAVYRDYAGINLFFENFDCLGIQIGGYYNVNVSDLRPGDILYYEPYPYAATWHYALYLGNGECISASSPSAGTCIRPWDYRPICKVRRMFCYEQ
ncbi:MAG: cell wall-binding repeat-containing protein [Lachnospiraceae bacterium]|nr:cell wall-binding repeat-containing protein [Candidatus Equihabitans merdae]